MAKPRQSWYAASYITPFLPAHKNTDPITSAEADEKITISGKRRTIARRCLAYLHDHPNKMAGEISAGLGLSSWQVMKRLTDLQHEEVIMVSGIGVFEGYRQQKYKEINYVLPSPKQTFLLL